MVYQLLDERDLYKWEGVYAPGETRIILSNFTAEAKRFALLIQVELVD